MISPAHYQNSLQILAICSLGLKNQHLISQCLDLELWEQAIQFKQVDEHLTWLLYKSTTFDFVEQVAKGTVLLVGEGNLSFALSLTQKQRIKPANMIATTFEKEDDLSTEAEANAEKLKARGAFVQHGVNSGKIAGIFAARQFDTIIFQFPHTGSREPVHGHNPNFILVRDFLRNAVQLLSQQGCVLISAVDSPHYRGAFQFEEAADIAGFEEPVSCPFDPSDFPGYEHSMTHRSGSALDNHDDFRTWVFRLK